MTKLWKPSRLGLNLAGYLILSFAVALLGYGILYQGALSISFRFINQSEHHNETLQNARESLKEWAVQNDVALEDYSTLEEWNQRQPFLYLEIYRENKLCYATGISKELAKSWEFLPKSAPAPGEIGFTMPFSDGTAIVFLGFSTPERFYQGVSFMCLGAAMILFLMVFLLLFQQKISYIFTIIHQVQAMESGRLSAKIPINGNDELTDLAMNINTMSDTLQEHILEEAHIKEENHNMIAALSHDMRTPLTAVLSYLDFIEEKRYDSPEKMERYVAIAKEKACQLKEYTDHLFDYCVDEASAAPVQTVDGGILLNQLFFELMDQLNEEGFHTIVKNAAPPHFLLEIAPQKLRRVFDNLVSNLLKYAEPTKDVSFETFCKGGQLFVRQTNGLPILNTPTPGGSGIGLRSCRQILSECGGKLQVTQNETCFQVEMEIPLKETDQM